MKLRNLFCAFFALSIPTAIAHIEPEVGESINPNQWAEVEGAHLEWGDIDALYPRHEVPTASVDTLKLTAWRGETVSARALLYSSEAADSVGASIAPFGEAGFVRYVITDDQRSCGAHNFGLTPWTVADIIDLPEQRLPLKGCEVRPVWCKIDVPCDKAAGVYDFTLTVGELTLPLQLTVVDRALPPASEWAFHTDFWQQPYAVSRYEGVERWSDAHFEALRPYLQQLARSGQKVITAILFYEPWGDQSHDKFDPMIETTRQPNGSWTFNYEIFDRYVELAEECGISEQINCYSMIPWDMSFRYFDLPAGTYKTLNTQTNTEAYLDLWSAFLRDFAAHLKATGRFDKTCIAMDERGLGAMLDASKIVAQTVPDMKMALAGNYHAELVDGLYDYCIGIGQYFAPEELACRKAEGKISTYYTCCSTPRPNNFSNNDPSDSAWLALYAVAQGFDGYLHWSWINWGDKPMEDSRFRLFSAGDTYLFYPGPRSSVRYERYIDGVQTAEKIRVLREEGADMTEIDAALGAMNPQTPTAPQVNAVKQAVNAIR